MAQSETRDLYLERCDGQEDQQWLFKSDGTVRNKMYGDDMCLSTGRFYDEVFPQLRQCDGSQFQLETGSNCESTLKIDGKCVYVRSYDYEVPRQLLIGDCNDNSLIIPGWMTLNSQCNRERLFANEEDADLTKLEQVLLAEDSEEPSAHYINRRISRLFWNWGCDAFHGSTLAMFQPPHCIFERKRRLQELEDATSASKRRLIESNGLVSTGKIYGTATGTLTESPKLGNRVGIYDNSYIHHINMRYNEHLVSLQLWSRNLELLAQGKFLGQQNVGGGMWARTQTASYEVPADNTCINMVRVYSEGQFINGIQWCSRRDGFEPTSDNTIVCSQVYGSDAGTLYTDWVPRYPWNGVTSCLQKIDIYHGEGSEGFIHGMKFWYLRNVDALSE